MDKEKLQNNKRILALVVIVLSLLLCSCASESFSKSGRTLSDPIPIETQESTQTQKEDLTKELSTPDSALSVHFIDVGQGDAILAVCGDEAMLVDGGNPGQSDVIYSYLKKQGIDHLKYIICTHPDEDHVGGLAGALNYAKADQAYCSETEHDSRAFESFLKYLDAQGIPLDIPVSGTELTLGEASGKILGPVTERSGTNNNSIVIKLQLGNVSFLLTGDAEEAEENELITAGGLESTVLKVGHHGSDHSTSDAFLDAVNPEYAVISCGRYNEYGHPTDALLHRLRNHGAQVYRTDMQGDVICTTDGNTLSVSVEHDPEADTFLTYHDLYSEEKPADPGERSLATASQSQETEHDYILNKRSKIFHWPDCDSVKKMSDNNKELFTGTREEAIEMGYKPCGNCHP